MDNEIDNDDMKRSATAEEPKACCAAQRNAAFSAEPQAAEAKQTAVVDCSGLHASYQSNSDADSPHSSAVAEAARNLLADAGLLPSEDSIVRPPATEHFVRLQGGAFWMGTEDAEAFPADGEGPMRQVTVDAFAISPYAVTNEDFARFVAATGYVTEAERFDWSYVFHLLASENVTAAAIGSPVSTPWWLAVQGAFWLQPEGPDSSIAVRMNHPVVHISWNDALAYCDWAGLRLPTESEWEFAARGGLERKRYPWGDLLKPDEEHRCNIWQGKFPVKNNASDGYIGTAPVNTYQSNGYGLYNVSGNVWEWCADWFTANPAERGPAVNPRGPQAGAERTMKGGSYLCHKSYCNRYRVGARSKNTPDSSTGNIGFRCVKDV
ncbi:formylglycine-generating enzyme family protein [Paenibacillus profundus]|uniref:Formylglycine-generating enzyme family protein n=1 Tax=Paenibacillus profundus TaxID=1173085 RepID=A0ABS8YAY9_9BACL|nr:formylglycine-generating enzyme family protein [Paenibacillus profundus]MCE5168676.1 formylglycine-generating enzyme family protein [Paenibacillus profundus]